MPFVPREALWNIEEDAVTLAGDYQPQDVFSKAVACRKSLKSSTFAERLTGHTKKIKDGRPRVALPQVPFELNGSEDKRPFPRWLWVY